MNGIRNNTISLLFLLLSSLFASTALANQPIAITLPDTLIKEIVEKSLPVNIPIQSKTILGSITVDSIKNLRLHKNKLSGHVTLSGHNLNIVTTIAGHKLKMKIGSLTMSFQCNATVRFDQKSQALYVKPVITDLQSSDKAKTEIASLITQLFNNHEFPLKLNKLKPFAADTGNKILTFAMRVSDVSIHPGEIHLYTTLKVSNLTK